MLHSIKQVDATNGQTNSENNAQAVQNNEDQNSIFESVNDNTDEVNAEEYNSIVDAAIDGAKNFQETAINYTKDNIESDIEVAKSLGTYVKDTGKAEFNYIKDEVTSTVDFYKDINNAFSNSDSFGDTAREVANAFKNRIGAYFKNGIEAYKSAGKGLWGFAKSFFNGVKTKIGGLFGLGKSAVEGNNNFVDTVKSGIADVGKAIGGFFSKIFG